MSATILSMPLVPQRLRRSTPEDPDEPDPTWESCCECGGTGETLDGGREWRCMACLGLGRILR